jgi:hypothetical protein
MLKDEIEKNNHTKRIKKINLKKKKGARSPGLTYQIHMLGHEIRIIR